MLLRSSVRGSSHHVLRAQPGVHGGGPMAARAMRRTRQQQLGPALHAPLRSATQQAHATVQGERVVEMKTVFGVDAGTEREAIWLAPKDGASAAKGVVLFMHGFSQGPMAYYQVIEELTTKGILVIAPWTGFAAHPDAQQGSMVANAAYWYNAICTDAIPGKDDGNGIPIPEAARTNVGLLAHSVGAGLSPYIAWQQAASRPFKAVHLFAPETKVVPTYDVGKAIASWPGSTTRTVFGVQYGERDMLAPPGLATALIALLRGQPALKVDSKGIKDYDKGTHIGFQDQLVWLDGTEVITGIIPAGRAALSAAPSPPAGLLSRLRTFALLLLPLPLATWLGDRFTYKPAGNAPVGDFQLALLQNSLKAAEADVQLMTAAGMVSSTARSIIMAEYKPANGKPGVGKPIQVTLPSYKEELWGYVKLLLVVTVVAGGVLVLGAEGLAFLHANGLLWALWWLVTGLVGFAVVLGVDNILLLKYVDDVQRPQSRAIAVEFFDKHL